MSFQVPQPDVTLRSHDDLGKSNVHNAASALDETISVLLQRNQSLSNQSDSKRLRAAIHDTVTYLAALKEQEVKCEDELSRLRQMHGTKDVPKPSYREPENSWTSSSRASTHPIAIQKEDFADDQSVHRDSEVNPSITDLVSDSTPEPTIVDIVNGVQKMVFEEKKLGQNIAYLAHPKPDPIISLTKILETDVIPQPDDTVVILGECLSVLQTVNIFRHIIWIHNSLEIILDLFDRYGDELRRFQLPYAIALTPVQRPHAVATGNHIRAIQDRICTHHCAISRNLTELLEPWDEDDATQMPPWPIHAGEWKRKFRHITESKLYTVYKDFSHWYATPRVSETTYTIVFGEGMKDEYKSLAGDVRMIFILLMETLLKKLAS